MKIHRSTAAVAAVAAALGLATLVGTSGIRAATAGAAADKITITIWDSETDPGPSRAITALIAQFEAKHPNVTVKRVAKNWNDFVATIKLAASSNNAPDLFQGNEGAIDQQLIKAHLIVPLDKYAKQYGWVQRFGAGALKVLRWTADGSTWGTGSLWGVTPKAEVVGPFYDKQALAKLGLKVPTTFEQFEQDLAVAKAHGVTPIMVGNLDRWPMGHIFMQVQSRFEQPSKIASWVYGRAGATFDTAATRKAAALLQTWAKDGYFEDGFNGVSQETAEARFAKGEGLFFVTGPWANETFADAMGTNVGFFTLPPWKGSKAAPTLGAAAVPYHIGSQSEHPEVAAALLDFLTNPHAADVFASNGDLPAAAPHASTLKAGSSLKSIVAAWGAKSAASALTPYLDWATPSMGDTLFGGLQSLTAGKLSPADFTRAVQADWAKTYARR
jgi:raffinose/stachyose/melibiose transport system substrate-binding protein